MLCPEKLLKLGLNVVRTVETIREQAHVVFSGANSKGHPEEPSVSRFGANQGKDFFSVISKPFCSLPLATVPVKSKADMPSKSN